MIWMDYGLVSPVLSRKHSTLDLQYQWIISVLHLNGQVLCQCVSNMQIKTTTACLCHIRKQRSLNHNLLSICNIDPTQMFAHLKKKSADNFSHTKKKKKTLIFSSHLFRTVTFVHTRYNYYQQHSDIQWTTDWPALC